MSGYQVKYETVTVCGTDYLIRSLLDNQQFFDPYGDAEQSGISPASWGMFGQVWPSARVLAKIMDSFDLVGKRVLEIGAGLALASIVAHHHGGDVTVSDWHPLGPEFLRENLQLNQLSPLKYQTGDWAGANPDLGQFDLIIGSDILYERQQPEQLAAFIHGHSAPTVEILIVDPDRGNRVAFCKAMARQGYSYSPRKTDTELESGEDFKGRLLVFNRVD